MFGALSGGTSLRPLFFSSCFFLWFSFSLLCFFIVFQTFKKISFSCAQPFFFFNRKVHCTQLKLIFGLAFVTDHQQIPSFCANSTSKKSQFYVREAGFLEREALKVLKFSLTEFQLRNDLEKSISFLWLNKWCFQCLSLIAARGVGPWARNSVQLNCTGLFFFDPSFQTFCVTVHRNLSFFLFSRFVLLLFSYKKKECHHL